MKHTLPGLLLLVVVSVAAALSIGTACRPPGPGEPSTAQRVVNCGSRAVADHAIEALPGVNGCLGGASPISSCLMGILAPAAGITIDVIACVVRDEGKAAAATVKANPNAVTDVRRDERARLFLSEQGVTFTDGPPSPK